MYGHVLKWVVVGRWCVFSLVRGMLDGYDAYVEGGVLGQYAIANYEKRCYYVIRDAIFLRDECGLDCYEDFLSSHGVSASCVFTFLIRGDVRYGEDLAYLSIASSRLALTATSKRRKIGEGGAYFREGYCEFSIGGSEYQVLCQAVPIYLSLAFAVSQHSRDICSPSSGDIACERAYLLLNSYCLYSFFSPYVFARRSASSTIYASVLGRAFRAVLGNCGLTVRDVVGAVCHNSAVSSKSSYSCFLILTSFIVVLGFFFRGQGSFV